MSDDYGDGTIPNKKREVSRLRSHIRYSQFETEYNRLNREPIEINPNKTLAKDFMNKPKKKFALSAPEPVQSSNALPIMADQEQAWLPAPENLKPKSNSEATKKFKLPEEPFEHSEEPAEGSQLSEINEGEYCIILNGKLTYASTNMSDIEETLNKIVFSNSMPIEEIVVVKRLTIKIGASLQ